MSDNGIPEFALSTQKKRKDYNKEEISTNKHMIFNRGTYTTPDGNGTVEYDPQSRHWDATSTKNPGVTAHCNTFKEAQNFAFYGH